MASMFYDGSRMRHRHKGEKKGYSTAAVVLQTLAIGVIAVGLAVRGVIEHIAQPVPKIKKLAH